MAICIHYLGRYGDVMAQQRANDTLYTRAIKSIVIQHRAIKPLCA